MPDTYATLPDSLDLHWRVSNPILVRVLEEVSSELLAAGIITGKARREFIKYAVLIFLRTYAGFKTRMKEEGKSPFEELCKIAEVGNDVDIEGMIAKRMDFRVTEELHGKEEGNEEGNEDRGKEGDEEVHDEDQGQDEERGRSDD